MAYVLGVVILVVGLLVSIALHEVGHMVPAKRFGVRVSQYMVGFGPTLWSRTRGETEYGLKAIPLGGYVRLIGMYPPQSALDRPPRPGRFAELVSAAREASAEEILPGQEHRAFYRLSTPKKVVVMLGGPVMNLVIAVVLMAVVMIGIGLPTGPATTTLAVVGTCVPATPTAACTAGDPPAPAGEAGLQRGDRIVSWAGAATGTWAQVQEAIRAGGDTPAQVVVDRAGEEVTLTVTPVVTDRPVLDADGRPVLDADGEPVLAPAAFVGISPTAEVVRASAGEVLSTTGQGLVATARLIVALPMAMVDLVQATVGLEERDQESVVGVVGVARIAGEIGAVEGLGLAQRVGGWLSVLASLNIALFVFNLIPLVPLDGGHVAGALWEGARRQLARVRGLPRPGPADVARMVPLAYGVFAVLAVLGLVLIVADVVAPVTI